MHLIDMSNGQANIAYQGQTPWHSLGSKVEPDTSFDVWMQKAGLNWEAMRTKAKFHDDEGVLHTSKSEVLYRSDTKGMLGVVSDRYKIVQPREVIEFYQDLVGVRGWDIEVAGSLDEGKRIWALAKTDAEVNIGRGVDRVGTYLLLATAFDGTMATVGKFTSIRTVCQNTPTMALNDGNKAKVAVPHIRVFDADAVKEELGIYEEATVRFREDANLMASRRVSDSDAMKFILSVIVGDDVDVEKMSTKASNIITGVWDLYKGKGMGSNLESAAGTPWGLVNSVSEYLDHHVNSRSANNRLRAAWFGEGEKRKQKAYDLALKMAA